MAVGEFHLLFCELRERPEKSDNYFRISDTVEYILTGITPLLRKTVPM
jgi:hypothetical protein